MSVITFIIVLAVAFVNGWTDAPNSVSACVATGVLPLNKALKLAAISDFAGSVTFGLLSRKVTESVFELAKFKINNDIYIFSIFSVMISVVVFAVSAWCFGFPTSESHAILAGLFGTSLCLNGGFKNTDYSQWSDTFIGLILSVITGFIFSYSVTKIFYSITANSNSEKVYKYQIVSGMLTAFMHGAQDSQKFTAIAVALFDSVNKRSFFVLHTVIALVISFGILTGGDRIIKKIGNDLVSINHIQGFLADFTGLLCLFCSTLTGIPVSTTHIKTSALMGAGSVKGRVDKKIALRLIMSWILTFPVCSSISYFITRIIIK